MSTAAATASPEPLNIITNPPILDEKNDESQVEQMERVVRGADIQQWADRDAVDIEKQPGIFGFLFKKNPSPEFIKDLAKMNETGLDPKEIRRLTRKIDFLILPALSICYMVGHSLFFLRGGLLMYLHSSTTCKCPTPSLSARFYSQLFVQR